MRRATFLISAMVVAILVAGGVALAKNISCPKRGNDVCLGTHNNDTMTGTSGADTIDVSGDPSSGTDRVDCGAGDGDTDTVTRDPGDEIAPNTCDGDVVTNVP